MTLGLLLAAGCVPADDEAGDESDPGAAESVIPERPVPVPPEGADSLVDLVGRLAVVDGQTMVVIDPDGANRQILDEADHVGQPAWSPTGQALAWTRSVGTSAAVAISGVETADTAASSRAPDADATESDESEDADVRLELDLGEHPAIYLSWSEAGDRVGVLRNTVSSLPPDLELGVADVSIEQGSIGDLVRVVVGQPLFSAWHTGESRLVTHVGPLVDPWPAAPSDPSDPVDGAGDENPAGEAPSLFDSQGTFGAPAWLDPETVVVADGATLGRLSVESGDYEPLAPLSGATRFVVSSDGSRIAYLARTSSDVFTISSAGSRPQVDAPQTSLHVLDVASGQVSVVGAAEMRRIEPIAWEWSPDGQLLAFLADSELEPSRARWYFWHAGSIVAATSIFLPSPLVAQSYLPFFDQYAQSITGWSPDSQAFAFAGAVDGVRGVYVHVLGSTPRSIRVTDGDMVTWSPENVAPGTGESLL